MMAGDDPAYAPVMAVLRAYAAAQAEERGDSLVIISHAVVLWEEVTYGDDGEPAVAQQYCIPSEGFSPAATTGLTILGRRLIERDVFRNDEDE